MAEPYIITIISEVDWDGTTVVPDLAVNSFQRNGRQLSITLPGAIGIVPPDFWGLFAGTAPKLVGVASENWNALNIATVENTGVTNGVRQIATLRPQLQHLSMFGGDRLSITTVNGGRSAVYLSVNALSERDHVDLALRQQQSPARRTFRLLRSTSMKWTAAATNAPLTPAWTFDATKGVLIADENGNGPIAVASLCASPETRGYYVSVRFSGSLANNIVYVIDGQQRRALAVQTVPEMQWSKVFYVRADDMIMFATDDPAASFQSQVEIEVVPIDARDRFVGRYDTTN